MAEVPKKIILSGRANAGKTSLVNQYLHKRFLHQYPSTIGVRIDHAQFASGDAIIGMIIWDLVSAGRQMEVPQASLIKTGGVIYVVDISEPSGFIGMPDDLAFLRMKLPGVPILTVANKSDKVPAGEIPAIISAMPSAPDIVTSAKDAINVSLVFERLAMLMLS